MGGQVFVVGCKSCRRRSERSMNSPCLNYCVCSTTAPGIGGRERSESFEVLYTRVSKSGLVRQMRTDKWS